jgi:protein TonB
MNSRLAWFLLISAVLHLLLFMFIKIDEPEKKEKPISVEIIEKEKETPPPPVRQTPPEPVPRPQPVPESKPEKEVIKVTPDDQQASAKSAEKQQTGVKDQQQKQSEKPGRERPAPAPKDQQTRRAEPDKLEKPELPKMDFPQRDSIQGLDREVIDRILNPTDVINRAAEGGGDKTGEDTVSMQQVKTRYTSYFYKFRRQLYQTWAYPYSAAMRGEQGTVRIKFAIHKDGRITDVQVVKSSGYPDLDNEAVRALRNMGGVPLPDSYELNVLRVDGYFIYYLSGAIDIY